MGSTIDPLNTEPEDVVFLDGDYAILKSEAIFLSGFNCYKATEPGGDVYERLNPWNRVFSTEEHAKKWLESYRKEHDSETSKGG